MSIPMIFQKRIRKAYTLAIGIIVILLTSSQVIIQFFLYKQEDRGRLINIAGRQRMLSQQLSKYALLIETNTDNIVHLERFKTTFQLFVQSHENLVNARNDFNLKQANSDTINRLFNEITPFYKTMKIEGAKIFKERNKVDINDFMEAEEQFLPIMDTIVAQYDRETDGRIYFIFYLEFALFFITLSVLAVEFIFIIKPIVRKLLESYKNISNKEHLMKALNQKMSVLNKKLKGQNDEILQAKEELSAQNEEIKSLLNSMEEKVRTRTALLSYQNEKFQEYAHINSHKVRGPLARIIGLVELIEKEENNYSSGYFGLLQICASELDVMIKQMNETLKEAQFYDDFGQPDIDINGN